MRKFTLLLALALSFVNSGFAQKTALKSSAQIATLSAPVASAATDVDKEYFTAHWSAVEGADSYYVQVGRTFTTTTHEADYYHLLEDFHLTRSGYATTDDAPIFLQNEGLAMRGWKLYYGETGEQEIIMEADGRLYSPVLDFSNKAKTESTQVYVDCSGTEDDVVFFGYYYYEDGEKKEEIIPTPIVVGKSVARGAIRLEENPTDKQGGFFVYAEKTNKGKVSVKKVGCLQTIEAGQQWDFPTYNSLQTSATSAKLYTMEYDYGDDGSGTKGVTEQFYYSVQAQKTGFMGLIDDESDFSNTIIVGDNSGVENTRVNENKIFVSDNLHVLLDTPGQVSIYSITGALVGSYSGKVGDNEYPLPALGVYVVKAGRTIAKVVKNK